MKSFLCFFVFTKQTCSKTKHRSQFPLSFAACLSVVVRHAKSLLTVQRFGVRMSEGLVEAQMPCTPFTPKTRNALLGGGTPKHSRTALREEERKSNFNEEEQTDIFPRQKLQENWIQMVVADTDGPGH